MYQKNKKPTFLENVDMMVNDTIEKINIDPNIAKILIGNKKDVPDR